MKMHHRYRVITDKQLGYQAQRKFWWFPFCWFPYGFNSFFTLKQARIYISEKLAGAHTKKKYKKQIVWQGKADALPDLTKPVYY